MNRVDNRSYQPLRWHFIRTNGGLPDRGTPASRLQFGDATTFESKEISMSVESKYNDNESGTDDQTL